MRAVAVTPGRSGSAALVDMPAPVPGPGEVEVRVLRVGLDGTDEEIDRGEYGEAPPGEERLVIGHESLGIVESAGPGATGVEPGDRVVAMVRRPDDCPACRAGDPDMCIKGAYTERGIKGRHGFLCERYVESPTYLVKVPGELGDIPVLLEPLTVVEKALRHASTMQRRMSWWAPRRALVLGGGSVGLLAAMLLRLRGIETFVYGRRHNPPLAARVAAIGATYVAKLDPSGAVARHLRDLQADLGPLDLLVEATGSAQTAIGATAIIAPDGILALLSVTGGEEKMEICASCLNVDLVLGNRAVFGSVNANRVDFEQGVRDLATAASRWPGWLDRLVTRRLPLERIREALQRRPDDIKVVVEP